VEPVVRVNGQSTKALDIRSSEGSGRFITAGKHVFWQDPENGTLHQVPARLSCQECGCKDKVVLVDSAYLATLSRGADFDCDTQSVKVLTDGDQVVAGSFFPGLQPWMWLGILVAVVVGACALFFFRSTELGQKRSVEVADEDDEDEDVEQVEQGEQGNGTDLEAMGQPYGVAYGSAQQGAAYGQQQSYGSYGQQAYGQQGQAAYGQMDYGQQGETDLFDRIDRNHDGVIDREEWRQARWTPHSLGQA